MVSKDRVKKIERTLKNTSLNLNQIGKRHNVSKGLVKKIERRQHLYSTKGKLPIKRPKEYYEKWRPPKGDTIGSAKLTNKKVNTLKKLWMKGWTVTSLADRYKISWQQVNMILQERSWKHIKVKGFVAKKIGAPKGKRRPDLGEKQVKEMRYLYKKGRGYKYIADLTGFAYPTVRSICIGRTWRYV